VYQEPHRGFFMSVSVGGPFPSVRVHLDYAVLPQNLQTIGLV
jgi:hypothetical protein